MIKMFFQKDIETMSRKQLEELQLERLKAQMSEKDNGVYMKKQGTKPSEPPKGAR